MRVRVCARARCVRAHQPHTCKTDGDLIMKEQTDRQTGRQSHKILCCIDARANIIVIVIDYYQFLSYHSCNRTHTCQQ